MSYFLFTNLFIHLLKWNCKIEEICYFLFEKWWSFRNLRIYEFRKFYNLEKLSNTLSVRVIKKK